MKIYKEKFQNAIKIYPCKKAKKLFHKIEIVFFLLQDFDPHKRNNKLIINVVDFLLLLLFIRMETKKKTHIRRFALFQVYYYYYKRTTTTAITICLSLN